MKREHIFYKCPNDCNGCKYCLGGLAYCVICKKGECELETYCDAKIDKEVATMNEEIAKGLEPLFEEAEKTGKWFYSQSMAGVFWFSPRELREQQADGNYCWGAVNWELRNPAELLTQAGEISAKAIQEYLAILDRVIESMTKE